MVETIVENRRIGCEAGKTINWEVVRFLYMYIKFSDTGSQKSNFKSERPESFCKKQRGLCPRLLLAGACLLAASSSY